jgi:hypothetical protein
MYDDQNKESFLSALGGGVKKADEKVREIDGKLHILFKYSTKTYHTHSTYQDGILSQEEEEEEEEGDKQV